LSTNNTTSGIEIIEDTIVTGLAHFLPLNKPLPTITANSPKTISTIAITDVSVINLRYTVGALLSASLINSYTRGNIMCETKVICGHCGLNVKSVNDPYCKTCNEMYKAEAADAAKEECEHGCRAHVFCMDCDIA